MNEVTSGQIICLSGPSGVGKNTIIRQLIYSNGAMRHSISMTTRTSRLGECEGIDYYFTNKPNFEKLLKEGRILEYDTYCSQYYGTPIDPLKEMLAKGIDVALDVTISGAKRVKAFFPDAITVFLAPPTIEVLKERLLLRGTESEELILKRVATAVHEMKEASCFDYFVINDSLDAAVRNITAIYEASKLRTNNQTEAILKLALEADTYLRINKEDLC